MFLNKRMMPAEQARDRFNELEDRLAQVQDEFDRIEPPDLEDDPGDLLVRDAEAFRMRQYWLSKRDELNAIRKERDSAAEEVQNAESRAMSRTLHYEKGN